ncbi:MAG: NifU family protein [Actinomycetota bacterium]
MTTTQTEPVLTITDEALEKIQDLRSGEDDADALGLRIEVTGVRGVDYTYDLAFEVIDERDKTDVVLDAGIPVVLPADDIEKLQGATLDLPSTPGQPGLVLRNPNRPTLPDPEELELTGELADDVRALLEQRINPAIAAHGGFAELVGVEGGDVYVRLGGGCQGCSMSRATVAAGIEQTLKEHLPAVTQVVDVTDHANGENPYYS